MWGGLGVRKQQPIELASSHVNYLTAGFLKGGISRSNPQTFQSESGTLHSKKVSFLVIV